uniref:Fibrinogen C-terminal domain-containing protein n=1 Tax=Oreochromis niloticus TaxID=8128 RepID=I3JRC1_ORENI
MKSLVVYCGLILAFLLSLYYFSLILPLLIVFLSVMVYASGTDCTQIKTLSPRASSGIYTIQPNGAMNKFKVYCEMRPDGGWTVFQKRTYKTGFGNLTQDFYLTKDKSKKWAMRVDLWDHEDGTAFAEYKNFRLGNEKTAFKLHVGKYRGNAGDAIRGAYKGIDQNGYGFSTVDRDNDGCSPCIFGDIADRACTFREGGGWWYSKCGSANLNGDWHSYGEHIGWASGLHWRTWKPPAPYSAKATKMMIKSV